MRIVFDHDVDAATGQVLSSHYIETSDPAIQTLLNVLKTTPASQVAAGYGAFTKMVVYVGQTRWQAILGEVVRLNDATARGILGV